MKLNKKRILIFALVLLALFLLSRGGYFNSQTPGVSDGGGTLDTIPVVTQTPHGQQMTPPDAPASPGADAGETALDEDGVYTTKEDLALYIHSYGHLPSNFITKAEAERAGWTGGSLERYCPGKCIGGDRFGNREGLLPSAKGRTWTECDVNTLGAKSRGTERIVFSNDGLIFYTADHYDSFEQLY